MRSRIRSVAVAALAFVFYSCSENSVTGPDFDTVRKTASAVAPTPFLISQVYGGGGSTNAAASYQRDFIELHNVTNAPQNILGYKVGYASAAGTFSMTAAFPSFTVPAGGYATIGMGTTSTGGAPLPPVQASGGSDMAAGAGKVILIVPNANNPVGACPAPGTYADYVAYGTASTACNGLGTTANTAIGTAAVRGDNGCLYTPSMADFAVATPLPPRGGTSVVNVCGTVTPPQPVVATVSVSTTTPSVLVGTNAQFTAKAFDNATPPAEIAGVAFTWSSSNTAIATVDASGLVTTLTAGDVLISAKSPNNVIGTASLHITAPPPPVPAADIVISQIFGGGGNAGSTILHDYIELYNHSNAAVDLSGWSVQYASAAGPTAPAAWQVTPLTGTIQPGKYLLVQEAAGTSVTAVALSNPDVIGSIPMGGTAGKIILARTTIAFTGTCPTAATIQDRVGYGTSTATGNCVPEWGARMSSDVSATLAAWRNNDGCDNTQIALADFSILAPAPRNTLSPAKSCTQPPRIQSSATIVINELLSDPVNSSPGSGQWFEVFNYGSGPVDLQGWTIVSGGSSQPNHTISSSVVVPAGGYAVLGRSANQAFNGEAPVNYSYFVGQTQTIWLDSKDFLMLVDNTDARVDSVAWTTMPHGVSVGVRNAAADNADANGPNWGFATDTFGQGDFGTPGANNDPLSNTPPAVSTNHITVSGRVSTDAPLPVGFESQIFPSLLNQSNVVQNGHTFTWSSLTPSIATIDPVTGVIHSVSPGTAVFHVVAEDGTVKNHSLVMEAGTLGNAQYGNNTEFGDPIDNSPADEYVVRRPQFTTSYNQFKGRPNWVSYDLNGSQFQSGTDRCNCFTHDPLLPSGFTHLTTADYTGAGSFAAAGRTPPAGWSYGIDRGHMTRSSDRTTGTIDNADTYYLSNVVPQFADLNQGPWNVMEGDLHAMAATGTKEIYIITGPAGINTTTTPGSNGTVKNEGKIEIPASTWKIAVIMPRGQGLANVHSASDLQIIAVNMPNVPGVRNEDWHQWETTVAALEQLTGYNFLSALPDNIEAIVEGRTRAPISQPGGPYTAVEGSPVAFNGSASSDPDNDPLTFAWNFGDGSNGAGVTTSHAYADNGSFTAVLTATDPAGASDATNTPVTITNAAPVVTAGSTFIANAGQSVTVSASFADAGANDSPWQYSIAWGDGSNQSFSTSTQGSIGGSHTYATSGSYSVTFTVTDKDGGVGSNSVAGAVRSAPTAVANGPYTSAEGASVTMSGSASTDSDGSVASYAWNFGDGSSGTGVSTSHVYANDGDYTVTLTVTDNDGLSSNVTSSAHVTNVAPTVSSIAGGTLSPGQTYTASGSLDDPGADVWTATVNYGDGTGSQPLPLSGKNFSLSHLYAAAGTYTVTVSVSDGTAAGTSTASVAVLSAPTAAINGPFSSNEGSSVSMSGAGSSDSDGTVASYAWNFGDGTTGTGASASHVYANDGDYTVTLTVTDNDALSSTVTSTAHVTNVAPALAPFAGGRLPSGGTYSASGSFSDPGADAWTATVDYGDGSGSQPLALSGTSFTLSHQYSTAGAYTVTVAVSDGVASNSGSATVTVLAAPTASVNGPFNSSEGSTVSISGAASSDTDGTVASYAWNFGDGTTGTGVSTSHAYANNGDFTVTLTVTDNDGLSGTTTTLAHVTNVSPTVSAIAGGTLPAGQTYTGSGSFTDPGADAWTATVNYGDGTGTQPLSLSGKNFSLSHLYAVAGNYTVTVSVSDGTAAATATASVTVLGAPTAAINGPFSSNEGSSVSMSGAGSSDSDGTVASYAWNFGDGTTGTGASVSHTYANDGAYTVTLVVTDNDGLSGTTTTTATVANVGPAIAHGSNALLASTGNYAASGSFTDAGADAWTATVNYGDGSGTSNLALVGKTFSLSHHYAAGSTYTVTVTVTDDDVSSTDTYTVRVQAQPVANAGGPYSSNEGSSVALSAAASSDVDGSIASYAWTFGDGGTGSGASVSHTYAQNGTFTATLTVTDNEGLTATTTTTVQVANVAAAIGTFAGATLLPAEHYSAAGSFADPGADTWTASVNYGDGSGTSVLSLAGKNFSLSHTYTAAGTYTVTVTVNDGTVASTQTQTVTVLSALQGANNAIALLNQLIASGKITDKNAKNTMNKLDAAQKQIDKDKANSNSAKAHLDGALKELDKAIASGDISAANAAELRALLVRLIATP